QLEALAAFNSICQDLGDLFLLLFRHVAEHRPDAVLGLLLQLFARQPDALRTLGRLIREATDADGGERWTTPSMPSTSRTTPGRGRRRVRTVADPPVPRRVTRSARRRRRRCSSPWRTGRSISTGPTCAPSPWSRSRSAARSTRRRCRSAGRTTVSG